MGISRILKLSPSSGYRFHSNTFQLNFCRISERIEIQNRELLQAGSVLDFISLNENDRVLGFLNDM